MDLRTIRFWRVWVMSKRRSFFEDEQRLVEELALQIGGQPLDDLEEHDFDVVDDYNVFCDEDVDDYETPWRGKKLDFLFDPANPEVQKIEEFRKRMTPEDVLAEVEEEEEVYERFGFEKVRTSS
jgi:hypothetical protein